ncbi:hypothetical protein HK096_002979, partial [Nowakowskiella sp. JEL0078]
MLAPQPNSGALQQLFAGAAGSSSLEIARVHGVAVFIEYGSPSVAASQFVAMDQPARLVRCSLVPTRVSSEADGSTRCLPSSCSRGLVFRNFDLLSSLEVSDTHSTFLFVGDSIAIPLIPTLDPSRDVLSGAFLFSADSDTNSVSDASCVYRISFNYGSDGLEEFIHTLELQLARLTLYSSQYLSESYANSVVLVNDLGQIVGTLDCATLDNSSANLEKATKSPVVITLGDISNLEQAPPFPPRSELEPPPLPIRPSDVPPLPIRPSDVPSLPTRPSDVPPRLPERPEIFPPSTLPQISDIPQYETQPKYAKAIIKTSETVANGIIQVGSIINSKMQSSSAQISSKIKTTNSPLVFKQSTIATLENVNNFSSTAAAATKRITGTVMNVVDSSVKSLLQSKHKSQHSNSTQPSKFQHITNASLVAVNNVLEAGDSTVKSVIKNGTAEAEILVTKKYGPEAGTASGLTLGSISNFVTVYVDSKGLVRKAVLLTAAKAADLQKKKQQPTHSTPIVSGNLKPSRDAVETGWNLSLLVVVLLSFVTRFWRLAEPHRVVFDEVHFGKFASYYLRRTYYFDVHPPLGKLLLALVGYLAGYDGHFLFDTIGDDYIENNVPYYALRAWPATCGALTVVFAFLSLKEIGVSIPGALFGAALLIFDNALVTQSRLILLD